MITIEVNKKPLRAKLGEPLLDALRRGGIRVPTLCHMAGLVPSGACRLCVVEVDGWANLVPSCALAVEEGLKVTTHSPRAVRARKTIVELLLASHPDDCLYCVRNETCQLQDLAEELGVRQRRYVGARNEHKVDLSSPSIVRDPAKCVLCGKCVRVCEEVQGVAAVDFQGRGCETRIGAAFGDGLNVSSCVGCGQCILACPTGALREQSQIQEVVAALEDPDRVVVVQHAAAVSVTVAEEFGVRPGTDACGAMTAALRKLGFDRVFDTSFAADLVVLEQASELVERIARGGPWPLMTSCSPGWVRFVEEFCPDFLENLSTCKSPQQALGAILKSHWAAREGLDPARIFSVAVMPCTAKKFEADRPEMGRDGRPDVDAVLTTRELARMLRMRGIDMTALAAEDADIPFGERSTAGKLFGVTGGATEAVLRTTHVLVTGKELAQRSIEAVRGLAGVKEVRVRMGKYELGLAVASGLGNARRLLDDVRAGAAKLHFVEVMGCPGGCIAGGGQPLGAGPEAVTARMKALYRIDRHGPVRTAHANASVRQLYREFLGEPRGERSRQLLHTHYVRREVVR